MLNVVAGIGAGFLASVLWFDLMFDVQVRGHHETELPIAVRESIAGYYRRVTTDARPMNRLVAAAMLVTLAALVGEVAGNDVRPWAAWPSLALIAAAVGLAASRTVGNAVRLGSRTDDAAQQSALARRIFRDHLACIAAVGVALILQIVAAQ